MGDSKPPVYRPEHSSRPDAVTDLFDQSPAGTSADPVLFETLRAHLLILGGPEDGRELPIEKLEVVIGRAEDADLRIDDARISRHHAQIRYEHREFRIRDLGSGNKTYLNGSEVKEYALRRGDKIAVGNTLLQLFVAAR